MPPFLIAAAVAAIWVYLKGSGNASAIVPILFGSGLQPGIKTGTGSAAVTNAGTVSDSNTVTNQPGTSSSGVPSTSAITQPFQNTTPGYSLNPSNVFTAPFRNRSATSLKIRGRNAGASPAPSGGGCGCGGGCSKSPSCGAQCGHADGAGSCTRSATAAPSVPGVAAVHGNWAAGTLPPETSGLNIFQTGVDEWDTSQGGVPAAPSYLN